MKHSLFSFGYKLMIITINFLLILHYWVTAQNTSYNLNSIPITGFNNSAFGVNALLSNTTGNNNSAIGFNSLRSNTTGITNTAIGANTLFSNTTGNFNFALGQGSLYYNTIGYSNSAIGTNALQNNVNGFYNIAIGDASLSLNSSGYSNIGIGLFALGSVTSGNSNVGIGQSTLNGANGNFNTAIGVNAGYCGFGHVGDYNTYVGYNTGLGIISGNANTILGANVSGLPAALSNTIILADGNGNQRLYIDNNGYAGFGTTSPTTRVEVNSNVSNVSGLKLTQLSSFSITPPGNGKALTVDATGNVILVTSTGGASSDWSLTGNAGTIDGTNFIGTTDNIPFNIRVNNQTAGRLDPFLYNTFYGITAGNNNSTGTNNTAIGYSSLAANTKGNYNTAIGFLALWRNTIGGSNTAIGQDALSFNTVGVANTAIGSSSLGVNGTGYWNTATGFASLQSNTSGIANTANGLYSLSSNETGSYNTGLGYEADVAVSLMNATAIGALAFATGSDMVRVGNSSVTSIGGYAGWTTLPSDGRVKKNIQANVPGLAFINKLKPVTYNLDLDAIDKIIQRPAIKTPDGKIKQLSPEELAAKKQKEEVIYTGFVAQDVEKAAKELNYDFSGVDAPKNDKDVYGLRYAEFVVPLVKAVQELSTENNNLKDENKQLQVQLNELDKRLTALELALKQQDGKTLPSQSEIINDAARLEQNTPNPFNSNTVIRYNIPQNTNSAQIIVTTIGGVTLKTISVNTKGPGQVFITAGTLSSGNYVYSLIVDGKKVDSKQMILTK